MNRLKYHGILLLAVACALSPAAAQPSATTEFFDLGGPCDDGEGSSPAEYYPKLREALKLQDHQQVIELQKQYVRAMCSNHYRWYGLAQSYLDAGHPGVAIQVLHAAHRRGAEITLSAFEHQQALATLIETPQFHGSKLGRELQELRKAAALRKDSFRAQVEALNPSAKPPERHVAEGACPFECCTYREWNVLETTPLYEAPFSTVVVDSTIKGDNVQGVTGDVHVRPAPVAVVHDRPPFERGEILFVLDYVGEGVYRYWRRGEIATGELWIDEVCLRPSRNCWAEYIEAPQDRHEPQWWILIETGDGVRGWTDRPKHFGNIDACG